MKSMRLKSVRSEFIMGNSNSEIYAIESLFLGKKTHIDILEPTDKDAKDN